MKWLLGLVLGNPYGLLIVAGLALSAIAGLVIWDHARISAAETRGRTAERQVCELEKFQSKRDAEDVDHQLDQQAAKNRDEEIQEERARTLSAQEKARDYERIIAELKPELQACRLATDADLERVR